MLSQEEKQWTNETFVKVIILFTGNKLPCNGMYIIVLQQTL